MSLKKPIIHMLAVCIMLLFSASVQAAGKMPSFELKDVVSGENVSSSEFDGKALFVTFFATWCPPCIEEIPALKKLHTKYKGDGFSVVGLSVDQGGAKVVRKLVDKKSINYPVMLADSETMQNFGGVYGIPVSFLVNRHGTVVKKYTGYQPLSILEQDLRQVL